MFRLSYDPKVIELLQPCLDYFMQLHGLAQGQTFLPCKDAKKLRDYLKTIAHGSPRTHRAR